MFHSKKRFSAKGMRSLLTLLLVVSMVLGSGTLNVFAGTITKSRTTSAFSKVVIAQCSTHVNVRKSASTSASIVGTMADNTAAIVKKTVSTSDGTWYYIKSGSVYGYVKASNFVKGSSAYSVAKKTAKKTCKVDVTALNVRSSANGDSAVIGSLAENKVVTVIDPTVKGSDGETWTKIKFTQNGSTKKGYVCKKYITLTYTMNTAKKVTVSASSGSSDEGSNYSSSISGSAIASKARSYVGVLPYVYGGTSLVYGADCSGFTQAIYRYYGKSIPRTAREQAYSGRSIARSSLQPGDLVFYGSSGISHVAIYIGSGLIVHEANSTRDCVISSMTYMTPVRYVTYLH